MLTFLKQTFKSPTAHIAIVVLVCILTYLPILSHSFVYDDTTLFLTWKTPKSFQNLQKFIEGDTPPNHGGNYRPVRTFIYAADYKLWGDRAAGYYAQAMLVNAAIAVFVYLIATAIAANPITGLVTALLFGVHPMHTESISFATASMDTIGLLFGFASIYFAITSNRMVGGRFYLSLVLMLLGFFTYEVVLVTPILLALFFYCFNHPQKKRDAPRYRPLVWYGGAVVYYGIIRLLLMHQPTARPVTYHGGSFFMNGIIISKFFYQYIVGLVFPFRLSVFHE
ncbi:hypothetical protein HYS00_04480, partial [Candidatus Microgenomates bacterium]|nr:hypothetical protein [Candidatus Microgenomates bacterium]